MNLTLITRTIAQQSIMYRLDYLASQLPSKEQLFVIGRQLGRPITQQHIQSLMLEIQLTHQQLANSMKDNEVKS